MKQSHPWIKAALVLLLSILINSNLFAAPPRHYYGGWLYTGYSSLFQGIENANALGGIGVGLGGGYQLKKDRFLFNTGLEISFLNSANKLTMLNGDIKMTDTQGKDLLLLYEFSKYKDREHVGYVQLPILGGMQINEYYFLAGVKIGTPIFGTYGAKSTLTTKGLYQQYEDIFIEMPNHYYTDTEFKNKGKSKFAPLNVMASVEFGMEFNKLIARKNKTFAKNKNQPRIRAAVFADYGFLNANGTELPMGAVVVPSITTPGVIDVTTKSLFASSKAAGANVNPFIVGIKGTIFIDVTPPRKPKPEPKPTITGKLINSETGKTLTNAKVELYKGVSTRRAYSATPKNGIFVTRLIREAEYTVLGSAPGFESYRDTVSNIGDTLFVPLTPIKLLGKVINAETQQAISNVKVHISDMSGAPLYSYDTRNGSFNTNLMCIGQYIVTTSALGYEDLTDTVTNICNEFVLQMKPQKKEVKFILKNMFFAFDDTKILEESNPALDELATFLRENPSISIKIIGHTDSKGSASYNQRLSEGRAKSVYQAMIDRGIDVKRLSFEGRGASDPIVDNDTEENRAKNRRVEFEIVNVNAK